MLCLCRPYQPMYFWSPLAVKKLQHFLTQETGRWSGDKATEIGILIWCMFFTFELTNQYSILTKNISFKITTACGSCAKGKTSFPVARSTI